MALERSMINMYHVDIQLLTGFINQKVRFSVIKNLSARKITWYDNICIDNLNK